MSQALLVAEPEPGTQSFLLHHLSHDGFDVVRAEDEEKTLELVERVRPDLVLLATELDVCRRLRTGEPGRSWDRAVPVIVLGEEEADAVDRVRAFDRGCDDYVTRPFHYDELLARIRAVLRRREPAQDDLLEVGEIAVDLRTRCVIVCGELVPLPAKEFALLARLARDPTTVLTKEALLREVWGFQLDGHGPSTRTHAGSDVASRSTRGRPTCSTNGGWDTD